MIIGYARVSTEEQHLDAQISTMAPAAKKSSCAARTSSGSSKSTLVAQRGVG
jgi:DNA invertase Pin-like site-specific DNA recombinase